MYISAIVTFIDILGFRELVSNTGPEEIKKKLQLLTSFAVPEKNKDGKLEVFEPSVIQFSDSIIRVRPIDTGFNAEYQMGIAFQELIDLVHAQAELAVNDVFLRGGVTVGKVYLDDNVIFGPAFIGAYDLESKIANFPRIVVSPDLISEIKTNKLLKAVQHSQADEINYINGLITRGDDGIYFVDYCGASVSEADDYGTFLLAHKSRIINSAAKLQGLGAVSAKYLWLANYHNSCVVKNAAGHPHEHLLISGKDFALLKALSGDSA